MIENVKNEGPRLSYYPRSLVKTYYQTLQHTPIGVAVAIMGNKGAWPTGCKVSARCKWRALLPPQQSIHCTLIWDTDHCLYRTINIRDITDILSTKTYLLVWLETISHFTIIHFYCLLYYIHYSHEYIVI